MDGSDSIQGKLFCPQCGKLQAHSVFFKADDLIVKLCHFCGRITVLDGKRG